MEKFLLRLNPKYLIKRRSTNTIFLFVLLLFSFRVIHAQTCGSVTATDISTAPATCPGNGTITAPTLASTSIYQLAGGSIAGQLQQNSPLFESLTAGSYTLTLLCTGEPAVSFPVTVASTHTALGMSLTGTMVCAGSGTINAVATGGFNGGSGATYQYAMWPASTGGANLADAGLTYGAASSFGAGTLAEGIYFVRVKDNCGNIYTQNIDLKPSKPVGEAALGEPSFSCSGGQITATFVNARLGSDSGLITDFSAPYYQYRIEKVSTAGSCEGATVESVIIPNTNITSATTLTSIAVTGIVDYSRYRIVITSPCGAEQFSNCTSVDEIIEMNIKPSRLCVPVGTDDIRIAIGLWSPVGYASTFPINVTITGSGAYTQSLVVASWTELYNLNTTIPETAFPITVTAVDACGVTKTRIQAAPASGPTPSTLDFYYRYNCVQENGNVNVYTYFSGNWFGMEYNTGPNVDRTKYEMVNSATLAVVSTTYGLSGVAGNEIIFRDIPAGATYFVRVTPPASVVGSCPAQVSNAITIPASEGLNFTVTPAVEKVCNNGLNNVAYNVVNNSGGTLSYKLYLGTDATGTLVSTSASATGLAAGTYYYEILRPATDASCFTPTSRTGIITIDAWQTDPSITRSLSVNCQALGAGPQTTGSALLLFSGYGPFRVERSINGGPYTEVAAAAVNSYSEASLATGSTYTYRVTDQCGKSVSQQVMIKPLSPRLTNNTVEPCVGAPYTLSAIDFGDPLTTYTWEKVGVAGTLATTREYTFPSYAAANDGTYKLTVSLLNGCVVRETFITLNSTNCGDPFATGSIGDKVWFDDNANGIQDGTESGAAGVPVSLQSYVGPSAPTVADLANELNWADVTGATAVTDVSGNYLFDGLETGYYRVEFGTIPNYGFTSLNTGADATVDSDAGTAGFSGPVLIDALGTGIAKDNMTVDAGLVGAGSIGDYVWTDADQNGEQGATEAPKAGITVRLYVKNASNTWDLVETTTTDATGKYLFDGLPAGTYQVEFVLPSGNVFTHSNQSGVTDDKDSDADMSTGRTGEIIIDPSQPTTSILRNNTTIDAGLVEGALPVKLSMFDVKKGENVSAIVRWTTTEEANSSHFEIQRSGDAKSWSTIGKKQAQENSKGMVTYRFDDMQATLGTNYYRLKMIDLDGTYAFSVIRKLAGETDVALVTVYPNPVSNELFIVSKSGQAIGKVELINQAGKVLLTKNGSSLGVPINVKSLPAGIYLVKITLGNGSIEHSKVIIVR